MKIITKNSSILFLIAVIAVLLRFAFLGSHPPSLTWDEVSWGYNAFALGYDGRDEFGKIPIAFMESFGDFKPPLYAYLDIIPVKLFGLNAFATRFPSAFFGTLSVLLTYFLVKEIFGKDKEKLGLFSAFLLAISPWHIMLSRGAFEANVASFFVILGIYLFFRSVRGESPHFLTFSLISFVAAMYTFNSARLCVPLILLVLIGVYHKKLIQRWKMTLVSYTIAGVLFLPLFLFVNTPQAKLRFNEVNIFTDINIINRTNQEIKNDNNSPISKIVHNRRFTYGVEYIKHYLDNLSPHFLFIRGDGNPKFSIQDVGQMYIWEIPFFIGGLLILFRKRIKNWWAVPMLIIIGLIPAGFARETPHALRIENSLPAFQIITAIGVVAFIGLIKRKRIALFLFGIIVVVNFLYFLHNYSNHYAREFSREWQYGYEESIAYVASVKDNYKKVYVTEALGRAYIYYLFYMKYNPQQFRDEMLAYREALGFVHIKGFSNIYFSEEVTKIQDENSLYISTPETLPKKAKILRKFNLINGDTTLIAYTL